MEVFYQLTDLDAGKVVANFPTLEDAFTYLQQIADDFGEEEILSLGLSEHCGEGVSLLAMEGELVNMLRSRRVVRITPSPIAFTGVIAAASVVRNAFSWIGRNGMNDQVSNGVTSTGYSR